MFNVKPNKQNEFFQLKGQPCRRDAGFCRKENTMAEVLINAGRSYGKINKNIYGHFAEHLGLGIYQGVYVGEDSPIPNIDGIRTDVVQALKNIQVPVIRWPGGSFSENYHWKDAIGPKEKRSPIINTSWGDVVEDNSFGTHEFFKLCELVGAAPYIAANITSGTVQELTDWVDYITNSGTSKMGQLRKENGREEPWELPYLGIGNENWTMRPEFYSDRFKLYASGLKGAGSIHQRITRIACGPDGADYNWTDTVMRMTDTSVMNGISLHYYTMPGYYKTDAYPWEEKAHALDFDRAAYYRTMQRALQIEKFIENHCAIMDRYDPEKKCAFVVDEWGTWYLAEPDTNPAFLYQQNTMRDAVAAGATLNIFNNHNERVQMANIAQMVNVLQAVILTKGEELLLTPTYYVFELYKHHQDAERVESYVQQDLTGTEEAKVPALSISASKDAKGTVHATVVNLDMEQSQTLKCHLSGGIWKTAQIRYIAGEMHEHNAFGKPEQVEIQTMDSVRIEDGAMKIAIPPCCVMEITLE